MPTFFSVHFCPSRIPRILGLAVVAGILGLLLLAGASPVLAQDGQTGPDRPCAACHPQEAAAWAVSPHALDQPSGAACNDCHGDYVRGHPDEGLEPLTVDSSACKECHADTAAQWEGTVHAEANVQCIGCHLSHSQELRLTDDKLCVSCHQEPAQDSFHAAHWYGEVACVECHMAGTEMPQADQLISTGSPVKILTPLDHDFVSVSSQNCISCHTQGVGAVTFNNDPLLAELRTTQAKVTDLSDDLAATKSENRSLGQMVLIGLGIGLGVGGFLGIAFALIVGYVSRREVTHVS